MSNEIATQSKPSQFDLSPQTFEQALTFSNYLAESDMVPKDFKGKPGNCLVAIQWGMEIGLKPLQAMQNIAVINGRPSLWGDAVIALARNSPVCEYIVEDDDGKTATCRVKRRGEQEQVRVFSMEDAKTAGLLGKQGPWTQYPKRMRQMRARAFAIRDVFPDVLKGLAVAEEVMDIPNGEPKPMGMAEVVTPEPKQEAAPAWPDEAFKKKLPTFLKAIADGKTPDDIISWAKTKGTLTAEQEAAIRKPADEVVMTYAQVADKITKAADMDKLSEAASLIAAVQDATQREELTVMSERRADELDATELK